MTTFVLTLLVQDLNATDPSAQQDTGMTGLQEIIDLTTQYQVMHEHWQRLRKFLMYDFFREINYTLYCIYAPLTYSV